MAALRQLDFQTPDRSGPIDAWSRSFLDHLRHVAMICRVKPRTDMFEACAMLHTNRATSREAFAEALMRCLGDALGAPARLHRPGTDEMSFDELWLVQLGRASQTNDTDSLRFLISSRVERQYQRHVRFLATGLAEKSALN